MANAGAPELLEWFWLNHAGESNRENPLEARKLYAECAQVLLKWRSPDADGRFHARQEAGETFGLRRLTDALKTGIFVVMNPRDGTTKTVKELLAGVEPPGLGPGPRPSARPQAELESAFHSLLSGLQLPPTAGELGRALVLLWHDHLDAAHTIAQGIENPDGSFVHAIMHRREPDYWNSKYWWRRVGNHPCFPEIARRVTDLLKSNDERDMAAKLMPRGEWDAFAFVDACEAVAALPASDDRVALLREIQGIEAEVALEHFLRRESN